MSSFHVVSRADDSDKHEMDVNYLLFHKEKLYSAGDDGKIKVWSPDLVFLAEVHAHPCSVFSLAASDDTLYSCSNDGSIKAWELETLKPKGTIMKDAGVEYWSLRFVDGFLYAGDDQGNITIFKDDKEYGTINVAQPVKDMAVLKNLLFTVKQNDVVITNFRLGGDHKVQSSVKDDIMGRAPLAVLKDQVVFIDRNGKEIILHKMEDGHFKEITHIKDAHDMIINAIAAVNWDEKSTIFTGGWDKIVKEWMVGDNGLLKPVASCGVEMVVDALTTGDKGQLYAAGGDGHIVCLEC